MIMCETGVVDEAEAVPPLSTNEDRCKNYRPGSREFRVLWHGMAWHGWACAAQILVYTAEKKTCENIYCTIFTPFNQGGQQRLHT